MSDIARLFFIIILLIVGLVAYFLVVSALFARVSRGQNPLPSPRLPDRLGSVL